MQHLHPYTSFLKEEITGNPKIDQDLDQDQQGMVYGIIDLIKRVKDLTNRQEIADHMIRQFKRENIDFDYSEFFTMCGLKSN